MDIAKMFVQFIIIFSGFMMLYIIYASIISKQTIKILDEDCDPEKYLMKINKRASRGKRNELYMNILEINRSAAYSVMGDYEEANRHLDLVDSDKITKYTGVYATYIVNRLSCDYVRGALEEAESIYESKLVLLRLFDKKLYKSIQMLVGERYFYLGQYDKSYEHLKNIHNRDLSKRQYLEISFLLAKMELMQGQNESAMKRLEKIVRLGNKLGVVKEAQEILASM